MRIFTIIPSSSPLLLAALSYLNSFLIYNLANKACTLSYGGGGWKVLLGVSESYLTYPKKDLHHYHGTPQIYAFSLAGINLMHVMAVVWETDVVRISVHTTRLPCSTLSAFCSAPAAVTLTLLSLDSVLLEAIL